MCDQVAARLRESPSQRCQPSEEEGGRRDVPRRGGDVKNSPRVFAGSSERSFRCANQSPAPTSGAEAALRKASRTALDWCFRDLSGSGGRRSASCSTCLLAAPTNGRTVVREQSKAGGELFAALSLAPRVELPSYTDDDDAKPFFQLGTDGGGVASQLGALGGCVWALRWVQPPARTNQLIFGRLIALRVLAGTERRSCVESANPILKGRDLTRHLSSYASCRTRSSYSSSA